RIGCCHRSCGRVGVSFWFFGSGSYTHASREGGLLWRLVRIFNDASFKSLGFSVQESNPEGTRRDAGQLVPRPNLWFLRVFNKMRATASRLKTQPIPILKHLKMMLTMTGNNIGNSSHRKFVVVGNTGFL